MRPDEEFAFGRHGRRHVLAHQGEPQTGSHHALDRRQVIAFDDHVRGQALIGEHGVLYRSHVASARWRNPRQRRDIAPAGLAERSAQRGGSQDDVVDRAQADFGQFRRHGIDDAESGIAFSRDDPLDDFLGRAIRRPQLQQRKRRAQSAQEVSDPLELDVVDHREVQAADHLALDRFGVAEQEVEIREDAFRIL